jgi:hypothetical protein
MSWHDLHDLAQTQPAAHLTALLSLKNISPKTLQAM